MGSNFSKNWETDLCNYRFLKSSLFFSEGEIRVENSQPNPNNESEEGRLQESRKLTRKSFNTKVFSRIRFARNTENAIDATEAPSRVGY